MGGGRRARQLRERRQRARRRLTIAGALVAVAVLAAGALALARQREDAEERRREGPATFIGVRDDVFLDVMSSEDGRTLNRIVDLGPVDEPTGGIIDISITGDGDTVFYSVVLTAKDGMSIRSVGARGGPSTDVVADGAVPAVSPDGKRLAYVPEDLSAIVVRDLESGDEHRWASGEKADVESSTVLDLNLSWSPDNRHLAFNTITPYDVFVLDTDDTSATSTDAARRIGPPGDGTDPYWVQPTYRPDGLLAVFESCCVEGPDALRLVDDTDGESVEVFRTIDVEPEELDFDESGRHVLWATASGQVWRATEDGKATKITEDVHTAAW